MMILQSGGKSITPRVICSLMIVWTLASMLPSQTTLSARLSAQLNKLPSIRIDYHPHKSPRDAYNASKLALLVEPRPLGLLAPLVLHMMALAPPDWPFLFIGSNDSIAVMNSSRAIREQLPLGRLVLEEAPPEYEMRDREHFHRALTNPAFYERFMPHAEWLFLFGSDAMICANAVSTLDDWLQYDWVGPPWDYGQLGGTGGLSLRRLSAVRRILQFQERTNDTETEGDFLMHRLRLLPQQNLPKPEEAQKFAVEKVYYETPMGYHVGDSLFGYSTVWADEVKRAAIWQFCPDLKMVMDMKLARERCITVEALPEGLTPLEQDLPLPLSEDQALPLPVPGQALPLPVPPQPVDGVIPPAILEGLVQEATQALYSAASVAGTASESTGVVIITEIVPEIVTEIVEIPAPPTINIG